MSIILCHEAALHADYPQHYTGALRLAIDPEQLPKTKPLLANDNVQLGAFSPTVIEPNVAAWREVFKRMGAKSGERCSLESLYRFWQKRNDLYHVTPFVDIYNAYSLTRGVPMGAYDAAKLLPVFRLGHAPAGLVFTPLGKPDEAETPRPGEVVYYDDKRILCRMWNLKDCNQTKITGATRDVVLMFDMRADSAEAVQGIFDGFGRDWSHFSGVAVIKGGVAGKGAAGAIDL